MSLALAGDRKAYERVLRLVSQRLTVFLGRKLPAKDRDDVMQEILLSIHKARHTYDPARPLMPWVMAIARYRMHDHWRRHYGHSFDEMADIEDLKNILSTDITETLHGNEDIRRILVTLPERQQVILELMYRQDKSVREVAKQLKMSVSAVKVAAHRSYKIFRKHLKA
ncbi:MAG: sigma-70 family RNA polymerase sigma factor [Proteobacteria bacterium]|nr:sigma-70 family RNA polymerase sigma factor [Pseudomonadota bacterium]